MRSPVRLALPVGLVLLLAACAPGGTPPSVRASSGAPCGSRLPNPPVPTGAPLAILRDVASGPTEYLAGAPGGAEVGLAAATGFSPPQLGGDQLYFSVRLAQTTAIYRAPLGGCAVHLIDGILGAVSRDGRAFSALVGTRWLMLDRDGKELVTLTGAAGSWTSDGRLVESTVRSIDVFSMSRKKHSIPIAGVSPLSPLGTHQELVATTSGNQVMDLDSGRTTPLVVPGQSQLRAPTGSPDGTRVAFLDNTGAPQVVELATGKVQPIAASSLPTGFAWSADSRWLAVQEVYGGVEVEVATGRRIDSGAQVVVSW